MAKLTEQEIAEIRAAHGIKPEHIGKQPPKGTRKPSQPPEWLSALTTK